MDIRTEAASSNDQPQVLIVGDASEAVANLQHLLEQHNYEVSTASKKSDAFRKMLDAMPDTVVLKTKESAQQSDSGPIVTEKAHEPPGEMSLPEMELTRDKLRGITPTLSVRVQRFLMS